MLTQEISQQSYESYIILRDRIVVGLVKSLNQGLWLHIRIHFTPLISKRIKDILTQKHQCNANEKNAFRKKKSIYFFQISAVCIGNGDRSDFGKTHTEVQNSNCVNATKNAVLLWR